MKCYLMFHLDEYGDRGITLLETDDLFFMDDFIGEMFKNTKEVRKYFLKEISEFCLDKKDEIIKENLKNNRNRTGAVSLFCIHNGNFGVRKVKIPILYGDYSLFSDSMCYKKIKESFKNDNILKELYNKKKYLLSQNEYDVLSNYFDFHNPKNKEKFIYDFLNRLKNTNMETKYFTLRSLANLCSLITVYQKKNTIEFDKNESNHKKSRFISYSDDDLFTSFIENDDFEQLNKYYDSYIIDRDSDYHSEKKIGGRK